MTTIPEGIQIVAERVDGQRVWIPEVRGQVFWPAAGGRSSGSSYRDGLDHVLKELTPAEHEQLLTDMAKWAEACLEQARPAATHLSEASMDEILDRLLQQDAKVISDCIKLGAHLYRASRGESTRE